MLRSSSRSLTRVIKEASVKSLKPRVTQRFASGHGGERPKSSDLPWAIPSLVITVPVCFWLYSTTPKMEPDHRRERKAEKDEARTKAKEAEDAEAEEEKQEEEKPEQATGEDNVEASAKKTEAADASDDKNIEPTGKGDIYNKQEGVSNMPTKPPHRTASAGPDEDTHEPVAKNSTTVDPSGKSDTKTKLEKVDGDDKKEQKKDDKKEKK